MELSSSQSRIWQPSELSTGSQRLEAPNAAGPVSGWSRRRQAGGRPARLHSHLDHRSDTGASTALRGASMRHLGPRQPARKRTTVSGMRRWSSRARCVPDTHHHPVDCMVVRLYTAVTHYLLLLAEGQNFFALVCSKASWFTWFIPVPEHGSYSAADRWYSSFETAATAASALTNKPRAMSMPAENASMDTVVYDQFS